MNTATCKGYATAKDAVPRSPALIEESPGSGSSGERSRSFAAWHRRPPDVLRVQCDGAAISELWNWPTSGEGVNRSPQAFRAERSWERDQGTVMIVAESQDQFSMTRSVGYQPTAATSRRRSATRVSADQEPSAPTAPTFASLLNAASPVVGEQVRRDADASTRAMFDSPHADGHDLRATQLQEQYRSAIDQNRANVAEQREQFGSEAISNSSAAPTSDHAASKPPPSHKAADGGAAVLDHPSSLGPPPSTMGASVGNPTPPERALPSVPSEKQAGSRADEASRANAFVRPASPAGSPPIRDSVPPGAAGNAAGQGSPNLAQQVAKALGGVGAGEAGSSISPVDAGVKNRTAADRPAQSQSQPAPRRGESLPRSRADDLRPPEARSFESLVNAIRLRTSDRHSSARIRLEPPELGRIRVDVRLTGQRLLVDVQAETESARALLTDRAEQLKTSMRQHGIEVERFDVRLNLPMPVDASQVAAGGAADPLQPPTPRHEPGRNAGPVRKEPDIGRRGALTSGGGEHSVRSAVGDRRLDFMA